MFPRISKSTKNGQMYEYLVVSESIHVKGKGSTTRNIANLGNIKRFNRQDVENLIDGFIKIFELEKYSLSKEIEIIESLEHGSIILWRKIWEELGLSKIIKHHVKLRDKRVKLEVEKYIEMMSINRCVDPLSKLGATRWIERTCYKVMEGYSEVPLDVTYFYRSMDQLLKIKEELEYAIFKKLRNLFSINVKLTFYDITSSFFYTENCPIGANGYSRDNRPDKKQIVIAVVTSYEGYPIKHYVFEGNTKDESTVVEVVKNLRESYQIKETIFVGDRGMISKLNLDSIESEGYDYIMGVKHHQDEICKMLFSEIEGPGVDNEDYKGLKVWEKKIKVKDFLKWKSKEILKKNKAKRKDGKFMALEETISSLTNKEEPGYQEYKKILEEITEKKDIKVSKKIFNLIKKYRGRYEDELRYVISLNEDRKDIAEKRRAKYISRLSEEMNKIFSRDMKDQEAVDIEKRLCTVFEGYKSKYKKYFEIERDKEAKAIGYKLNSQKIEDEKRYDGIFVLSTNRADIDKLKVVESYKNLKEVEMLFDDLKNFVDIRPMRHWLEVRVRAHVFICILSLLLKRIFEINYIRGKSVTEPLEEISKSKLVKYKVRFSERDDKTKDFLKVTNQSPMQKKYFKMVGIRNPMSLERFIW